ncbi:MAG: oligosaccharide flippase family protein [Burkholderiales bacterium]|nr:oligosaccharide flippase family protein [Burkholderiales bacterium]
MYKKIQTGISRAISSGFVHVFTANIVSYLVAFCASIAYAHLMQPNEFGIYSFCYTVITFSLLVNGFGAASGVLQFVSKTDNQQLHITYLKYAMHMGILFNICLSIIIFLYATFTPIPIANSKNILIAMAFFPVGRLYIDVFQAYLRATRQNKLLAQFSIGNNSMLLVLNICGIYFHGLMGLVITTYISYLLMIIISSVVLKLPNVFSLAFTKFTFNQREFFAYSVYATIGNAFSQLLFTLDILILGYIVQDSIAIANYKVATIIPFALNFIPGVIVSFFYPTFAKNSYNLTYIKQLMNKVSKIILGITIPTSLILIISAKPLLGIIFGTKFTDSVLPFQILIFGFSIASMRILYGNVLASLGKAKFAMWFNILIAIINVIITYTLVHFYGIIGASCGIIIIYAIATLFAKYALNSVISTQAN